MDIFEEAIKNKIDYDELKRGGGIRRVTMTKEPADISVIVPVHGRIQYNNVLCHFLKLAIDFAKINASVTIVEHDDKPLHDKLCPKWVNYIFIPKNGKRFNKSLCFNAGALLSSKASFFLCHDVDTIMDKWLFSKLYLNMMGKDAVQAFTKRRLLMCGSRITQTILDGYKKMKELPVFSEDIKPAQAGAAGGSMFMTSEMFFKIGGWWEVFTEYSIEDQTVYDCLNISGVLGHSDNPPIEMYHLWHEPSFFRRTKQEDWNYYYAFKNLPIEKKKEFIKLRSELLSQYIHEAAD